jgi:hypothetical protein
MAKPREGESAMSVFDEHDGEIEHFQKLLGRDRGSLAVALDRITAAAVMVGQHASYCHHAGAPGRDSEMPAMDIRQIALELSHAKQLIQSVMEQLREDSTVRGKPAPRMPLL